MYINLILGAVALAAVWMLLYRLLVKPDTPEKLDPAAILAQKLEERRAKEESAQAAWERIRDVVARKLEPVEEALNAMFRAMPQEQQNLPSLAWEQQDGVLRVSVRKSARHEARELFVSWRLKDSDLRAPLPEQLDDTRGFYAVREGMERERPLPDVNALVRHLAAVIADELA